ncbi:MAG: hypothetical protein ABR527_08665 [Gemmatimonadota bacterium]
MRRTSLLAIAAALMAPGASWAQTETEELLAAGRTAAAGGDYGAAYRAFREAYDPSQDDPRVLAALAGAASASGELALFRALLDSVVGSGPGHRNALEYWAALALEAGEPMTSVTAELDAYVTAQPGDVAAHEGFVRVLVAHDASAEALSLLDRAVARGAPPEAIALPRGDARAHLGEGGRAVEAYAEAIVLGDERGEERIRALLAAWPSGTTLAAAVPPLERARERAEPSARARLVVLLTEARAAAGQGETALAELRAEPSPETRARALRALAASARAGGDLDLATRALAELERLGPSVTDPADAALRAQIERAGHGASSTDPAWGSSSFSDRRIATGDLALARGEPDSAIAAYATVAAPAAGVAGGAAELEALSRVRLVRALVLARAPRSFLAALGSALSENANPAVVAARLDTLSGAAVLPDSTIARALVAGLAAEWRGRAGHPAAASAALEAAAMAAGDEAPALLLAAGRWAAAADELERARALWRRVVERHDATPYALEARRLLARPAVESR